MAAGNQLADEYGVPVPCGVSHSPAMNKITISFGSPFGSRLLLNDHLKLQTCR